MGGWTARELDIKDDAGRSVLMQLRRLGTLSGSSESESSSDDDDDEDDTVVQRHFEETPTFGHRTKSRCASADVQTQCLQGGLDSDRPFNAVLLVQARIQAPRQD